MNRVGLHLYAYLFLWHLTGLFLVLVLILSTQNIRFSSNYSLQPQNITGQ